MFKVTAEASKKTGVKLVEFDGEMLSNEKHIKEEFCLANLQQLKSRYSSKHNKQIDERINIP